MLSAYGEWKERGTVWRPLSGNKGNVHCLSRPTFHSYYILLFLIKLPFYHRRMQKVKVWSRMFFKHNNTRSNQQVMLLFRFRAVLISGLSLQDLNSTKISLKILVISHVCLSVLNGFFSGYFIT